MKQFGSDVGEFCVEESDQVSTEFARSVNRQRLEIEIDGERATEEIRSKKG